MTYTNASGRGSSGVNTGAVTTGPAGPGSEPTVKHTGKLSKLILSVFSPDNHAYTISKQKSVSRIFQMVLEWANDCIGDF